MTATSSSTLRPLCLTKVNDAVRPGASGKAGAASRSSTVGRNRPSVMLYPAREKASRRLLASPPVRKYGESEGGRPFRAARSEGLCVDLRTRRGAARCEHKRKREMEKRAKFHGSMPALVTPFKAGAFDENAFRALVSWQIENGTDGLVPVGTTGESPTLSHEEHQSLVQQLDRRSERPGPGSRWRRLQQYAGRRLRWRGMPRKPARPASSL